jgi:hypothetical protein
MLKSGALRTGDRLQHATVTSEIGFCPLRRVERYEGMTRRKITTLTSVRPTLISA